MKRSSKGESLKAAAAELPKPTYDLTIRTIEVQGDGTEIITDETVSPGRGVPGCTNLIVLKILGDEWIKKTTWPDDDDDDDDDDLLP